MLPGIRCDISVNDRKNRAISGRFPIKLKAVKLKEHYEDYQTDAACKSRAQDIAENLQLLTQLENTVNSKIKRNIFCSIKTI